VAVGQTHRQLSLFVMALCYSRLLYVQFTLNQRMEQFLACHQNAFAFFGNRVPEKVMVDNLRSAVLRRLSGEAPTFNPHYMDFARHSGFTVIACNKGNYQALAERRLNPRHHVQKIVALSEIYGTAAVARAMEDAFAFQAFSCEYITNLLESRQRLLPEPAALQLTRRQDLLEIEMPEPDLTLYEPTRAQEKTP
jgi:hypothetical protein